MLTPEQVSAEWVANHGKAVITQAGLTEIAARWAAATPGPWHVDEPPWGDGSAVFTGHGDPHGQRLICDTNERQWQDDDDRVLEDAAAIAHAPTDIAVLLAMVHTLIVKRDALAAEVARMRPVVEAACAYRPRIGNIEDLEVDTSAVGYERWRLLWELVRAIDAYRATEAVT